MSSRKVALLGCVIALALVTALSSPPAAAQTLGTVTGIGTGGACPAGRGFDTSGPMPMTCYTAWLTGCPGADDLQFVYGVETPAVTPLGTIVILGGQG
jgi:hypothetical protein